MKNPDYTLNLTQDGEGTVHLHADEAGLDALISKLQDVKTGVQEGICEHDHLMTEDWGGDDLSVKNGIISDGHSFVHHLKIFGWTEEWIKKHGFE